MARVFDPKELKKLYKPEKDSSGEQNGQITIIGGSSLFHGAPLLSLKVASRIVDMVFFASPDPSVGRVAELIKSKLFSFIWIPWDEVEKYIQKSDAVLIGPGFQSFRSEKDKSVVEETKKITEHLVTQFPNKKWVIDAGSLQVMEADWIPENAVLTPNRKEFEMLFRVKEQESRRVKEMAEKYGCTIVHKGPTTTVANSDGVVEVKGGNAGMTKGGTGDVQAGLTVALLAKNEPFLVSCAASYIIKKAAEDLYESVGFDFNADDLADQVPKTLYAQIF